MNTNFAKIVALAIVGSVAKALFAPPSVTHIHTNTDRDTEPTKVDGDD